MIKLCAFSDEAASDLEGQICALERNGILYTELRSVDGKNVKDFSVAEAREIGKRLNGRGICVWAVGSPLGKADISVDLKAYLETVKHVCALANALGTDKIRAFSFYNAYGEEGRVFEYMNRMAETAKRFGVTLYHENEKEIYGDTAERVLRLMNGVRGWRYVYDPANFVQAGESAERALSLLSGAISYYHIKDVKADTGELVPAGCGSGEIPKLLEGLAGDETLTVEPHLALFEGYGAIDGSEMKHEYEYASNGEAFDAAVNALKTLLHRAGYREVQGGYEKHAGGN